MVMSKGITRDHFTVIGIETVDYHGEHNKIEFAGPITNKSSGLVEIYDPITVKALKKQLIEGLNQSLENKIKGIVSLKIKVVGSGEEKWI